MTFNGLHFRKCSHKNKRDGEYTEWQLVRGRRIIARGRTRIAAAWGYICLVVRSMIPVATIPADDVDADDDPTKPVTP